MPFAATAAAAICASLALISGESPGGTLHIRTAAVLVGLDERIAALERIRIVVIRADGRLVMQDEPAAMAGRALLGERFDQALADALGASSAPDPARRDLRHLMLGAVTRQAFDQTPQHQIAVGGHHHVDEIDHDHAADITQTQLARSLGCLQVASRHRLLKALARPMNRPVFTSIVVMASVRSMTIDPPEGRYT